MDLDKLKSQLSKLNKATENDKKKYMQGQLDTLFKGKDIYPYLLDYDEEFLYVEVYYNGYSTLRIPYEYSDMSLTIGDSAAIVFPTTDYKVIEEITFEKSMPSKSDCILMKEFQNNMQVIECLYIAVDEEDGVGDFYASEAVCEGMVDSFNKAIDEGRMTGNYFHHPELNTDDFSPVKAWMNPVDCYIGDSFVKSGQPLVLNQFHNEDAYNLRRYGSEEDPELCLKGVSIGAKATWEKPANG